VLRDSADETVRVRQLALPQVVGQRVKESRETIGVKASCQAKIQRDMRIDDAYVLEKINRVLSGTI